MASGYTLGMPANQPKVSVFAPTPMLTVMIEAGPADEAEVHVHAGGQGPWIANMLSILDAHTVLCTAFGGEIGGILRAVLAHDRIEVRGVPIESTNGCDVEDRRSGEVESLAAMPPSSLDRHESDDLCNLLMTAGIEAGITVLTGPAIPGIVEPDVYRRVAADLTGLDVRVVADLSGEPLESALESGVTVLKVSDDELPGNDPVKAARAMAKSAEAVVLTRQSAPALLFYEDGVSAVRVPSLEMVDHRGAGDSMTAGIAAGLARGYSLVEAIRLGAAAGAVNVTRHGLASGRRDTIEALAERVDVSAASREEIRDARAGHQ